MIFRVLFSVVTWVGFAVFIRLPLILIGFVTVPLALLFKAYHQEESRYHKGRMIYVFDWPIMLPWNNPEDGFYYNGYFDNGFILTSLRWTLIRNPVNGLREVPILSFKIEPAQVRFVGSLDDIKLYDTKIEQWFYCWHGLYSCFYWQFDFYGLRRFWLGWALYPQDSLGLSPTSYRRFGAGFKSQFKRVK
jgi:hypothetical protein